MKSTAIKITIVALALTTFLRISLTSAEIPVPDDAPQPLSPDESVKRVRLPDGFRLDLVAAEPLIREPSGTCWDAKGRLFVSELHGYNLDGQFDIEELNKTGKLDLEVRRIDASPEAVAKAKEFTFGTVKLLTDTDGDGRMDKSQVFADHIPPCYGICPARDGIIAVGSPDILFLADRDGDGTAEVREVLFTGFPAGKLERGINCPQWGPDDWIYVGRGWGGGTITGPHLKEPVKLPESDFRIKADGTAIEPILGNTTTIGLAFTDRGERFVPLIYVAPIPWRYLVRNPDMATGELVVGVGDKKTYPISKPHPWRVRRAEDPGFSKFYTENYGAVESAPNGYFTSTCSPLVYQDDILPGLHDHFLVCEPSQNMVHRAVISREGPMLHLTRAPSEEHSEFLASSDQWFNPMALAQSPDGSVVICDFYREIIEDYSAVPRYLQQQYGLKNGDNFGRVWRLTHRDAVSQPSADMSSLSFDELVDELASHNLWRRQTARRLLIENGQVDLATKIASLVSHDRTPAAVINALYTLEALNSLDPATVVRALNSPHSGVRIHALRLCEPWLDYDSEVLQRVEELVHDDDGAVALQVALSLGESDNSRALNALAELSRTRGDVRWMDVAVLSSVAGRAGQLLDLLLEDEHDLGHARPILILLMEAIAAGRNPDELSKALEQLNGIHDRTLQSECLEGLKSRFTTPLKLELTPKAVAILKSWAIDDDAKIAVPARTLVHRLQIETPEEKEERLAGLQDQLVDAQLSMDEKLAVVSELALEGDPQIATALITAVSDNTPQVQTAILEAVFSRRERLSDVVAALEDGSLAPASLSAVQRAELLEHSDEDLRARASKALQSTVAVDDQLFARYRNALTFERDVERGGRLFTQYCAVCHQAHGVGIELAPNLSAEAKRAEETYLQDILAPSSTITAGYGTYIVITNEGQVVTGLLKSEGGSSVTLKQQEGKSHTILRKDIEELKASNVSLMPDNLTNTLSPQDVADILAWIRKP